MNWLLYWITRLAIAGVQMLPLDVVAWLGRRCGELACMLDARHRRVARKNLTLVYGGEKSRSEIRALVWENFRRIGESFACGLKTAAMSDAALGKRTEAVGEEHLRADDPSLGRNRVLAVGHFGNFEVYARVGQKELPFRYATTYRALNVPGVNRAFQELRDRTGCLFFERRSEAGALRRAMTEHPLMVGFLSDQHAGGKGLPLPFMGHLASTTSAPAVFAARYKCPLHVSVCYRTRPGYWRIEVSKAIPLETAAGPRPVEEVMLDVNRILEAAVRRDPANWFWVHRRWRPGVHRPLPSPKRDRSDQPDLSDPSTS